MPTTQAITVTEDMGVNYLDADGTDSGLAVFPGQEIRVTWFRESDGRPAGDIIVMDFESTELTYTDELENAVLSERPDDDWEFEVAHNRRVFDMCSADY